MPPVIDDYALTRDADSMKKLSPANLSLTLAVVPLAVLILALAWLFGATHIDGVGGFLVLDFIVGGFMLSSLCLALPGAYLLLSSEPGSVRTAARRAWLLTGLVTLGFISLAASENLSRLAIVDVLFGAIWYWLFA